MPLTRLTGIFAPFSFTQAGKVLSTALTPLTWHTFRAARTSLRRTSRDLGKKQSLQALQKLSSLRYSSKDIGQDSKMQELYIITQSYTRLRTQLECIASTDVVLIDTYRKQKQEETEVKIAGCKRSRGTRQDDADASLQADVSPLTVLCR